MSYTRSALVPVLAGLCLSSLIAGCADEAPAIASAEADLHGEWQYLWWEKERDRREDALAAHLASQADNFDRYRSMPAGTIGIPTVIFRLFPEVLPQYWGPPASNFAVLGLANDPYDPGAVLPLGLGHIRGANPVPTPAGNVHLRVVGLTCATCHSGRVQLPSGEIQDIVGAPSTEFKFHLYRTLLAVTVNHPDYTAANFRAALAAKPAGWLYNDPALAVQEATERAVFNAAAEQLLASVKGSVNAGVVHGRQTLGAHTYAVPNAPSLSTQPHPGQMDAMGSYAALSVNPALFPDPAALKAVLPPRPALVDQMYIWKVSDRPSTKWGGEVVDPTHSLAGAAMGMVGNPNFVNMEAVNASAELTWDLPAKPYPFQIHLGKAVRGWLIYQRHCAGCHAPGNDNLLTPAEVGTDGNRAIVLTDYTVAALRQMIRIACSDPVTCRDAYGAPLPDESVMRKTGAYAALPLDGIWSRAPYLHNGSVPTLRALLTGDRPATFYRGNISYDQRNVGFTWDRAEGANAALYQTTLEGNSNVGHSSAQFTGLDWRRHPARLDDLLEYLKTL